MYGLAQEGFLNRKSQKVFVVEPEAWRERWEEAVNLVSKVISSHTSLQ